MRALTWCLRHEYVRVHSSHSRVFFSLVQSTRSSQVEYELDEGLISFGSCLERGQYAKAGTDPLHTEYDMLFCLKLKAVDLLEARSRLGHSCAEGSLFSCPLVPGAPVDTRDRSHVALTG